MADPLYSVASFNSTRQSFLLSKITCPCRPQDSRPDLGVITIVDIEGGIRQVFPNRLALALTSVAKNAMSSMVEASAGQPKASSVEGSLSDGVPDKMVRLCVRRLQGTRTLLRKNFKVAPSSLLYVVFSKACERLRLREGSVVFVHDGVILSGRREARTLVLGAGCRSVHVFAVCKTAWACKQRAAARRGLSIVSPTASTLLGVVESEALGRGRSAAWRSPTGPLQIAGGAHAWHIWSALTSPNVGSSIMTLGRQLTLTMAENSSIKDPTLTPGSRWVQPIIVLIVAYRCSNA